jgi:putative intracellular protease/amidase
VSNRTDTDAVPFVKAFAQVGKPVVSICHGPWTLVTSCKPEDLDAFNAAATAAFAG